MKTNFKVELKIKNVPEKKVFENVIEIVIEGNFLFITTHEEKNKDRIDPIDLFAVDYWREIGEKERVKK